MNRIFVLVCTPLLLAFAIHCAASTLQDAVEQQVTVRLASGKEYHGELLRVIEDRKTGEPRSLRLRLAEGSTRTVGLRGVKEVLRGDQTIFETAETSADGEPGRRMTRSARRAAEEAEKEKQHQEEQAKWLARLKARGVRPWPQATDQQHEAAIAEYKQRGEQAQQMFPNLRLFETERFLVYSSIPPAQVSPFISRLDQMHEWMTATYNLPEGQRVWLGKAPVYAFLEKAEFAAFERQFFQNDPAGAYGLCHQDSEGNVLISCYRGQQPLEFAAMLVHETSHGFIHRYQTRRPMPSWVNEGMADFIADQMVPQSQSVKSREAQNLARLKQNPTIRTDFFGKGKISFDEYGLASSLTRFMLSASQENYVKFIQGLKEGMTWEESLRHAYNSEPDELLAAYARWLGVPALRVQ